MEIYLIRHTTPNIEKGICYGHSDLGLAKTHIEEFKTVLSKIPESNSYHVYSSPLQRCVLLAKQFKGHLVLDNRLKELNFGDWELQPWNDIPEKQITPWMNNFVTHKVPNGESYTELAERVNCCISNILNNKLNTSPIIIVLHAGPLRAFLSKLVNIDLKDSFNIKVNYGDVFHVRKTNNTLKLIRDLNL